MKPSFRGFLLLGSLCGLHLTDLLILYSFSGGRTAHHTGSGHPKTDSLYSIQAIQVSYLVPRADCYEAA